jgi:ferritin-like metal-binding protein YciE
LFSGQQGDAAQFFTSFRKLLFMEKMNDLRDLLKHEIMDLYSAEEQIIAAMPAMIGKASNPALKTALEQHLRVTEGQLKRLEQVQQHMGDAESSESKGLLSRLFKRSQECRGMKGLIEEGNKVMAEDMSPEVLDAAIIACAQKIEHYEICGYGTARAFARELNLGAVAELLEETLNEEYEADDRLTDMAVNRLNKAAESTGSKGRTMASPATTGRNTASRSTSKEGARAASRELEPVAARPAPTSAARKTTAAPKTTGNSRSTAAGSRNTTASKGGSNTGNTGNSSRSSAAKSSGRGSGSSRTR